MRRHGKRAGAVKTIWLPAKPYCSTGNRLARDEGVSDQTASFGEFAFTARSASQVLDKTEQIKAVHLRAIAVKEKKKVSLQPTLTRRMIRDVGAHINAANYQRTYFKLQMKACVTEIKKKEKKKRMEQRSDLTEENTRLERKTRCYIATTRLFIKR